MRSFSPLIRSSVFCVALVAMFTVCANRHTRAQESESPPAEVPASPAEADTSESPAPLRAPKPRTVPPPRKLTAGDRDDLEAFFDGAIGAYMENKHIAGGTVAVVSGNEIIFQKGYGYADVEAQIPVDPATTMFRIGSISKLLVWTAVMQLVEEGKLDLDADVNTYLKDSPVTVPGTFPEAITLKSLLTHTPGYEDSSIGLFAREFDDLEPLGDVLHRHMPARVRPPSQLASYSNHGTALAGYIVERVSGMPWEDFVEQRILQPLDMKNTTVRQPKLADLPTEMSKGYKYREGRFKEESFEYVPPAPAGSASASARDVGRFLLAHLHDGELDGQRILKPETAKQMRERLFEPAPGLDGMCYGFWEMHCNGQRLIQHGGDTVLFHSFCFMLPEHGTGMFVSFNTDTSGGVSRQLAEVFLDRYYPAGDRPRPVPPEGFKDRAKPYLGTYKLIRQSETSVSKLGILLNNAKVSLGDDESLVVGIGSNTMRFAEVEPNVFAEIGGEDRIVFKEDPTTKEISHLFLGRLPAVAMAKMVWHESPRLHAALFGGGLVLLVSAVLGWPFVTMVTRGELIAGRPSTAMSRLASGFAWLGCVAVLAIVGVIVYEMQTHKDDLAFGLSTPLKQIMYATPAVAVIAAVMLLFALMSWGGRYWRFTGRVHYLLVALAAAGIAWQLYYWNFMPLNFTGRI